MALDNLTSAQTAALGQVTVDEFVDGAGEGVREVRRIRFKLIAKISARALGQAPQLLSRPLQGCACA